MEYDRAIEERQIAWTSRYQSVRQSTVISIIFMILFIGIGTTFFVHQASIDNTYWSVSEGLLFSIYTITTVGYGHLDMPNTVLFQWYIIIYIFVGIATLTILVAQIYQCIALETNRVAVHANDVTMASARRSTLLTSRTTTKMRQWVQHEQQQRRAAGCGSRGGNRGDGMNGSNHINSLPTTEREGNVNDNADTSSSDSIGSTSYIPDYHGNVSGGSYINNMTDSPSSSLQHTTIDWVDIVAYLIQMYDVTISFLRENEYGRSISVLLPFVLLIAIGAAVIGPIEGWTVTESIYFSVVSLTTVGFGDYYPTKNSSIWFCCIWLPFSVGFMSLYLGNIAAFYIRLSDRNIARIENVLRKRIQLIKEKAQVERRAVLRRALRGQQQQQQQQNPSLDTNDSYSNDGGSSIDDDLVLSTNMEDSGVDCGNGNNVTSPDHATNATQMRSQRMGLSRKRFFGFSTIPTEDGLYYDGRDGGGEAITSDDPVNRDSNSVHSMSNSIYSNSIPSLSQRRERILRDSMKHTEFTRGDSNLSMNMTTMKDVLHSVHQTNLILHQRQNGDVEVTDSLSTGVPSADISIRANQKQYLPAGPESEYLSVRSNRTVLQFDSNTIRKKPSFALRALVQERFAEIIATDIAGYQNGIEIKDCTLTVTIDILKKVSEKWLIPRRARKAFRAVSFEALYFVGEHGLITKGAEALFSLSPIEFHQLFSPLLASFGDAESMESWLESTQALADVDLSTSFASQSNLPQQSSSAASVLKVPPKISVVSSPKVFNHSRSLPATVSIPSQPKEVDELPEIA
jgi:hypothetical protein